MTLLLALLAALALATLAYMRIVPRAVTFRRRLSPDRLFPGESADLVVEIENRSYLPIPWLITHDRVPEDCRVGGAPPPMPRGWPGIPDRVSEAWRLGPRERRRRHLRLVPRLRGVYAIGPGDAWFMDPVGWREGSLRLPGQAELIVYPRLLPPDELGQPGERPLGSRPRAGWLYADPLQVVGVRPYEPGDPYRQVHWAASARTGSLQVRRCLPAHEPAVALFVDLHAGPNAWGVDRARAEAALSIAATLAARVLIERHGWLSLHGDGVQLEPARGPAQLRRVLETLARAGLRPKSRLFERLGAAAPRLDPGCTLLVAAPWVGPEEVAALARLGRPTDLFLAGGEAPPGLPPAVRLRAIPDEQVRAWFS